MTDDPTVRAGTEGARRLLSASEQVLDELINEFRAIARQAAEGEDVPETEIIQAGVALASVRTTLLKEVKRHEAGVRDSEGLGRAAPLDLDDVRSQIGRRLDRIRDTR